MAGWLVILYVYTVHVSTATALQGWPALHHRWDSGSGMAGPTFTHQNSFKRKEESFFLFFLFFLHVLYPLLSHFTRRLLYSPSSDGGDRSM